jgi:predicted metal-binding membrane protein
LVAAGQSRVPRHERLIALASLLVLAALAWLYLWQQDAAMAPSTDPVAQDMPGMSGMDGMAMPGRGAADPALPGADVLAAGALLLTALMWAVMMAAMMLPSAAPAILLYGSMVRKHRERGSTLPAVWVFALGYLAVWTAFSVGATGLQAALQAAGLLTSMMDPASAVLSGVLLIAAGIYQWLPVKQACLQKCRAPLSFFLMRWKAGPIGAFRMGTEHGAFCVGCCWALMLLLFAVGVMNLLWVAGIAALVLIEKLLPGSRIIGRAAGVALAAAGVAILVDDSVYQALRT